VRHRPAPSDQLPVAAATPMLAAAGIVVTEIRTPISAPDFTIATQSPAIGPNSGPTTIAPTIRIGESR
jgi:hypothetical protein